MMTLSTSPEVLGSQSLEQRAVNAIRVLAMDAVQKANSGHPGLPMGAADLAYVLFTRFLKFDPTAPDWADRDRFILSAGHGCMLHYALLYLTGYDVSLDDLKNFRQWDSNTPGHPEFGHTAGIETTTGPLGQGLATAVGMAMAETHLADRLNQADLNQVDHFTYVLASDGDMMEGVQAEAASLAGHLGLGKLIVMYDDNKITIDGSTDLSFSEDVGKRYDAYGWHIQRIDGHDREAITEALTAAKKESRRPSLIMARTHIALGSPHKQDSESAHGSPLGDEEIAETKAVYGWPAEPKFLVPEDVLQHFRAAGSEHRSERERWEKQTSNLESTHPEIASLWNALDGAPTLSTKDRPTYKVGEKLATRAASGKALQWLSKQVPSLWGGSADLAPSNKTLISDEPSYTKENRSGRNLHFGVREHGMAAIMNGMALHGGVRPYGGTFLIFSDYLRPSLRLSALMNLPVIYVFTHDSIFLGEDGPTHQPIANIASLRAIPQVNVYRPADAEETTRSWELALERGEPSAIVLTRQGLPTLDRSGFDGEIENGAYIAYNPENAKAIVFATGSEVWACLKAANILEVQGHAVRVVAVPSWELFEEQSEVYRKQILAPHFVGPRFAVEAASPFGWERFVGIGGHMITVNRFGASAPAEVLADKFGFSPERIVERIQERL